MPAYKMFKFEDITTKYGVKLRDVYEDVKLNRGRRREKRRETNQFRRYVLHERTVFARVNGTR